MHALQQPPASPSYPVIAAKSARLAAGPKKNRRTQVFRSEPIPYPEIRLLSPATGYESFVSKTMRQRERYCRWSALPIYGDDLVLSAPLPALMLIWTEAILPTIQESNNTSLTLRVLNYSSYLLIQ